jgi:hypothetical protein
MIPWFVLFPFPLFPTLIPICTCIERNSRSKCDGSEFAMR